MTGSKKLLVQNDTFVEFKSRLGNTIVHPSKWSSEDKGDAFILTSPDGYAVINVLTFTVEGTGDMSQFQDLIVSQIEGTLQDSDWSDIDIGGIVAKKRYLVSADKTAELSWRVYLLRNDKCYHAILLNAAAPVMELNGGFYEEVVRSFKGIRGIS